MSERQTVGALQRSVQELEAERLRLVDVVDTWRERAERAEARLASITGMQREELARTTAEAQRKMCAAAVLMQWGAPEVDVSLAARQALRDGVLSCPLVTEVES